MLRTTKLMKDKYEKIQKYLSSMIPEKWEEIYLYASVDQNIKGKNTGELYFYYLPKGILKKKPVNVYEIPQKFNINEEEYLDVVKDLYNCIKDLKQDFIETEQPLWSSLTISIANYKFKVEYSYDKLPDSEEENENRRIIWRYEYLGIGGEKKEERKVLDQYYNNQNRKKQKRKETYEAGLYVKSANNEVSFDKEQSQKVPKFEREEKPKREINAEYQKVKRANLDNTLTKEEIQEEKKNKSSKNQILKGF